MMDPTEPIAADADVAIVGAGPCGLFQVFELGLLGVRAHVIDALDKPGGQCAELYPEKPIYDIPAYPVIGAQELVDRLLEQIRPFEPTFHLGHPVTTLSPEGDRFRLETAGGTVLSTRAVVIAGGVGAFEPVRLRLEGIEAHVERQVHYRVTDAARHDGRRVVILGGGDSALDWALSLAERAASVTLVHRSTRFRAQEASVQRMQALCDAGRMTAHAGHVHGFDSDGERLAALHLKTVGGEELRLEADDVLVFFGLSPKLGPIADWGLALDKHQIEVDTARFETSIPGIHAVGDISAYPGKKKLILSGFHEAALAAFAIKQRLHPGEKVPLQYTTTSTALHKRLGVG